MDTDEFFNTLRDLWMDRTFAGPSEKIDYEGLFWGTVEKYASEQYNAGVADTVYDYNQAQED